MSIVLVQSGVAGPGGGILAPTYSPNDALAAITPQLANITLDATAKGHLCNMVHNWLWNLYPWRWERKILPDITLVDDTQDYTTGVPADFKSLMQASVVRTDSTPDVVYELEIRSSLQAAPESKRFPPTLVAFHQELNTQAGGFRIFPNVGISSGVVAVLRGVYRMNPALKYTSANLTTTFAELPDAYFNVYKAFLMYYILFYDQDDRAGSAQTTGSGRVIYTGQLAVAMSLLGDMINAEDIPDTDVIHPAEPLGNREQFIALFP